MRLTKLDGLRGIASLMVVFFHYAESFTPSKIYNFFLIRESYTFVDFFFVLSGFVITYNYHTLSSLDSFWTYLKKRFIRLYPMLFFSVMIYFSFRLFTIYLFPLLVDGNVTLESIILKAFDSLLFTNSTPILGSTQGLNIPSWSISSEMISYIIFGVLAILSNRKQKRVLFAILVVVSGSILFYQGTFFKMGDYGFLRGLFSFLLGYFVWELSLLKFKLNNYVEYLIPFLIVLSLYWLNLTKGHVSAIYLEYSVPLVFSAVILIILKTNGFLSKLLNGKAFRFLGDISYSLYLNHYLVILIVPRLAFSYFKLENNDLNQILVFLMAIALSILYSLLTYKHIEQRLSSILKKRWLR